MNITEFAKHRHSSKAFDPTVKIEDETIEELMTLLRFSPSSVNSQPWHFLVASTTEAKERIAKSTQDKFPYNEPKIINASHVVVLCSRTELNTEHLQAVLQQESVDGRFATDEAKMGQKNSRQFYTDLHRYNLKDSQHWMEKQVYLSLGTLLLGAATLQVDACPIEGFDAAILDEVLDLRTQGFSSVVIVALGYRSDADFNASLPKSRLPERDVITYL